MKRMKTLILAGLAATLLASPVYADGHGHHDNGRHEGWHHPHRPQVAYVPVRSYYYAPPRVVYYQQPVYAPAPVYPVYEPAPLSISWFFGR